MRATLFTACQVVALMLLSPGVLAVGPDHKDISVPFELKATYRNITCLPGLRDSVNGITGGATTIDFGTFSPSDKTDKTVSVALTLDCSQTDLPDTVKTVFEVVAPASVGEGTVNTLYPVCELQAPQPQKNLYYEWKWGSDISKSVKSSPVSPARQGLNPGDPVDLTDTSAGYVYEVVHDGGNNVKTLSFPLDITRKVKNAGELKAGDYTAGVKVTISYE
ncbi:TPA: hypothetical protein G9B49_004958 [Salmonella enterica]|nr:hypothetical protein [Salmonella enterica]